MDCVILAAGYATRMYPLTENFPKPLLEVAGKPILSWLLHDLEQGGHISRFIIVTNHRFSGHFEAWKKENNRMKTPLIILDDGSMDNGNRLGAVRDIQFALDALRVEDDLMVLAGDNLLDFSLNRFITYFFAKGGSCIMRHREPSLEKLRRTGVAEVDARERVITLCEKPENPKSEWAVPPFYIYRREDLPLIQQGIEAGCGTDAPGSLMAWICEQTDVFAMEMPGKRYDIGNLQRYEEIRASYKGPQEEGKGIF